MDFVPEVHPFFCRKKTAGGGAGGEQGLKMDSAAESVELFF